MIMETAVSHGRHSNWRHSYHGIKGIRERQR